MKNQWNFIFDLDGCLIDSSEVQKTAFFGSYKEIVGDDNCPTYEEYIKHTGDSVDNVFRKMGLPAEMAEVYRRISSEAVDKILVNWDAIELVEELRGYGSKIAICTGKDYYRTVPILEYYHIENLFDVLVCADAVAEPKPSAMPILKAIEEMKAKKESVFMIGDGYNDILSAKNAGVKSVLTLWYGDGGVPKESDFVVKNVLELRELLGLE